MGGLIKIMAWNVSQPHSTISEARHMTTVILVILTQFKNSGVQKRN